MLYQAHLLDHFRPFTHLLIYFCFQFLDQLVSRYDRLRLNFLLHFQLIYLLFGLLPHIISQHQFLLSHLQQSFKLNHLSV